MRPRSLFTLLLLTAAAACGDDGTHHLADGGRPDASHIDGAPDIDAPLAPVTVTVKDFTGTALGDVPVYFLNADSSVVSATTTDANGVASAVMDAGGSVTVLGPQVQEGLHRLAAGSGVPPNVGTFEGVKPGDQLRVDLGTDFNQSTITVHLIVPTDLAVAGATYELHSTCGEQDITPPLPPSLRGAKNHRVPGVIANNAAVDVTLYNCGSAADMAIVVSDDSGVPVDSIYAPNTAVADDTTVTIAGPYVSVVESDLSATNLGSNANDIEFTKDLLSPLGDLVSNFADVSPLDGSGAGSASMLFPATTGTEQLIETDVFFDGTDGTTLDSQYGYDWGSDTASFTYDGSAKLLPHFTSMPSFDATTETVSWTQAAGGRTVDATIANLGFQRAGSDDTSTFWNWTVVAPGSSAGAIKLPTLPTDVFDYNPKADDQSFVDSSFTFSIPGGYDVFRPFGIDVGFNEDYFGLASQLARLVPGTSGSAQIAQGSSQVFLHGHHKTRATRHGSPSRGPAMMLRRAAP